MRRASIDPPANCPNCRGMEQMKAIFVVTAAVAFAISPFTVEGFNGFSADQFPIPQVDPPAQPAGYAFGIWGLIYLWLIAGAVYGLLKRHGDPDWDAMRWPLIASLVMGAAWIPVAQMSPIWATVLIWAMLGTAIWALLRAGVTDRLWLQTPIAIYAGWLTAASCVGLALVLAGHGVIDEQMAALAMIVLALVIASTVLAVRTGIPEYAATVIWALVGIIVANAAPLNLAVVALCGAGIAALVVMAFRQSHSGM